MIPLALPWVIVHWVDSDAHARVECLGCDWCATMVDGRPADEIDELIQRIAAEHRGCNPDNKPLRYLMRRSPFYNDPGE